ncbi:MAG: ImmA/IrrE family metallo-endopeptidase [Chloroflexi bacterium]|nr:ImmA/IrrE family metallo-endopeptidase [Chloroflexota bacterium]
MVVGIAHTRAQQLLCLTGQSAAPVSAHRVAAELDVHSHRADLPLTPPGFVARTHSTWYVYTNQHHGRRRWNLTHELGHIVLEHKGDVLYCGGRSFQGALVIPSSPRPRPARRRSTADSGWCTRGSSACRCRGERTWSSRISRQQAQGCSGDPRWRPGPR